MQSVLRALLFAILALIFAGSTLAQYDHGIVSIDNITQTSSTGLLMAGNTHQVSIRYDFRDLPDAGFWLGGNGFEVYSPDGADWGYLQGTTGPLMTTVLMRGVTPYFAKHYYFDGATWSQTGNGGGDPASGSGGPDTKVGFFLYIDASWVGYVGGLDNDIAVYLEFETRADDIGRTICIDTNNQITAWEWTAGSGYTDWPQWDNGLGVDGPRCLKIVDCSAGADTDGDGLVDNCDNCPDHYNPLQEDRGGDAIGDACSNELYYEVTSGFGDESTLQAGQVHRVTIYLVANADCGGLWQVLNAWKLFSPDGADWQYLAMTTTPEFDAAVSGVPIFRKHFHKTAGSGTWQETANGGTVPVTSNQTGTDTAGFYYAMLDGAWAGMPSGYHEPVAVVEFSSDPEDGGRHICIDTSSDLTPWGWACGSEISLPIWDYNAPICFEISDQCCIGRVGDANALGGDEPTIGDVSVMIDAKFISGTCYGTIECLQEADVNKSGGHVPTCDDVTIGDISTLIDYLFITGRELGLPYCMQ